MTGQTGASASARLGLNCTVSSQTVCVCVSELTLMEHTSQFVGQTENRSTASGTTFSSSLCVCTISKRLPARLLLLMPLDAHLRCDLSSASESKRERVKRIILPAHQVNLFISGGGSSSSSSLCHQLSTKAAAAAAAAAFCSSTLHIASC